MMTGSHDRLRNMKKTSGIISVIELFDGFVMYSIHERQRGITGAVHCVYWGCMKTTLAVLVAVVLISALSYTGNLSGIFDSSPVLPGLSTEEAIGQMLLIGFPGPVLENRTRTLLNDIQPGGVILFDYDVPSGGEKPRNIVSPVQLRALTADVQSHSAIPLLIAVDAEGGLVNRLKEKYGFPAVVPSAEELGEGEPDATGESAGALGAADAGSRHQLESRARC